IFVMRYRPEDRAVHLRNALHHDLRQCRAFRAQARETDIANLGLDAESSGGEHAQSRAGGLGADAIAGKYEESHAGPQPAGRRRRGMPHGRPARTYSTGNDRPASSIVTRPAAPNCSPSWSGSPASAIRLLNTAAS